MSNAPAPAHGLGYAHRPHKFHRLGASHPASSPMTVPECSDLRRFKKVKNNQGRSETCGGHGSGPLTKCALLSTGAEIDFEPSPHSIWAVTSCIEEPGTGPLPDGGVDPVDILQALASGIRPMPTNADGSLALSPDGRLSDVWTAQDLVGVPSAPPANIGLRPTAEETEECFRYPLDTSLCQLLDPQQADFEDHLCASLGVDGIPVGIGIHATPAFQAWGDQWTPASPPLRDSSGATNSDGHWVGIYAHATVRGGKALLPDGAEVDCDVSGTPEGTRLYWVGNSWGDWGTPDGGIWVEGPTLRKLLLVAITWNVRKAAAP